MGAVVMIASIEGQCVYVGRDRVILEVGGIGYSVLITESLAQNLCVDKKYRLQTLMIVRENEIFLVGFRTAVEREFFKLLTTISGIGPKAALKILDNLSPSDLASCIMEGDTESLKQVPGVGTKTAKRLILELQEKIGSMADLALPSGKKTGEVVSGAIPTSDADLSPIAMEAISVLVNLGCTAEEAKKAVQNALANLGSQPESSGSLVMAALGEMES